MASPSAALAARGVTPPQRSPLAEAHARRPAARSPSLVATLHARGQAAAPGHGVRFKHPRVSVDSTTISLGLPRCPWARDRTATGAIKVPTLLDPAGDLPALGGRTAGQRSALALARGLRLPTGSLVAMERGASDDRCRCRLPQDTVDCLIRHKSPAPVQVTSRLAVSGHHGVSADQPIMRQGSHGHASPDVLRRVGARDPETGPHAGC